MNTVIIKKEIVAPTPVIAEVCELILDNELTHEIIAADEEEDTLTLEVQYEKEDRNIIHQIDDIISDYEDEEDDEDDE